MDPRLASKVLGWLRIPITRQGHVSSTPDQTHEKHERAVTYPGPDASQRLLSRCAEDVRQRATVDDQLRRVHHPGPPVAATLLSCVIQEWPSDLKMHAVLVLGDRRADHVAAERKR